jgi:hypothetical protein
MNDLNALQGLGLSLPSPSYLFGMLLFSLLGMGAYWQGKRAQVPRTKWLGVALMFYSYAVSETWQLYALGLALVAALLWPWWQNR